MSPTRIPSALAFLTLSLALAACRSEEQKPAPPQPQPAPAIDVVSADGLPFRLDSYRGKLVLLTFGYTSCPDVCPLTLSRARSTFKRLGKRADEVALVFVSVDPERDDPARLRDYVRAFDSRFVALPLDASTLASVTSRYGITVNQRAPDERRYAERPSAAADNYTIDHTGGFVVVDRQGRLRARLPHGMRVEELAAALQPLLDEPEPLTVVEPRAQVTPAGVGAAYLTVENRGTADDRLVSVEVLEGAGRAELHEVIAERDVVRMQPRPDGFTLARGEKLHLSPGGKHLMLYGVRQEARTVRVTLRFQHGGPLEVTVPIQDEVDSDEAAP